MTSTSKESTKTVVSTDGHSAVLKCRTCGAVTRLNYKTRDQYLKACFEPCRCS